MLPWLASIITFSFVRGSAVEPCRRAALVYHGRERAWYAMAGSVLPWAAFCVSAFALSPTIAPRKFASPNHVLALSSKMLRVPSARGILKPLCHPSLLLPALAPDSARASGVTSSPLSRLEGSVEVSCEGPHPRTHLRSASERPTDGRNMSDDARHERYAPIASFKGWVKPGIIPPGVDASGHPEPGETLDALCGHFRIFQLADGNKYTTDDLLVAWYASSWCPSAASVLDLGSGIGSVGMMVAWRLTGARIVSIEAQSMSVALARKSVKYNGLDNRFEVRQGDLRDLDGAPGESFDLITASPPYFPQDQLPKDPTATHPQKQSCRYELRGSVADYCRAAARLLAPGGAFALVFPIAPAFQMRRVLAAAREAGLCIVRHRPVVLKEGEEPLLGLWIMGKYGEIPSDFDGWTEPALTIRQQSGAVHPEYASLKLAIGFRP